MSKPISCFKAYDARGKVPTELNEEMKRITVNDFSAARIHIIIASVKI